MRDVDMQSNLLTFISVIAVGIFILEVIVIIYLHQVSKKGKDNKVIQDQHYLELNLKFQYLLTFFLLASAMIFFLGWNVKSQVAEELKFDISSIAEEQIDSINRKTETINKSIAHLENRKNEIHEEIETLTAENEQLKEKHKRLNDELTKRSLDIKTLLRIYIVVDVPIDFNNKKTRFYFKDLKPINADKLPDFKKPPIVNIQATTPQIYEIVDNESKDYVVIRASLGEGGKGKITFWIVERE